MGQIAFCFTMAKHILHTRALRRRFGLYVLVALMALFTLGVFVIGAWLESNLVLFTLFWGVVFALTALLLFLGLYDALRVVSEVKKEHHQEVADNLRELADVIRQEKAKQTKDEPDQKK